MVDPWQSACRQGDLVVARELAASRQMNSISLVLGGLAAIQGEQREVLRWLWHQLPDEDQDVLWLTVCDASKLELAQWMLDSLEGVDPHSRDDTAWVSACGRGDLQMAQWLWNLGGVDPHARDNGAFLGACSNGHLDVVRWWWGLDGVWILREIDPSLANRPIREAFSLACESGHLQMARWLARRGKVEHTKPWVMACLGGHLEVAQWLWRRGVCWQRKGRWMAEAAYPARNRDSVGIRCWLSACNRGDLQMARWLSDLIELSEDDRQRGWTLACEMGQLELVQWLWNLGGIDLHAHTDLAWRLACVHGHLEMAKWLWSLGGIDHLAHDCEAWHGGYDENFDQEGWLAMMTWLLTLGFPEADILRQRARDDELAVIIDRWIANRRVKSARAGRR